jgi:LmbE family N-acetylglucosaminyl deacetylase
MHVVAIGAHPDDVEIGCGGALAKHIKRGDTVSILILTKGEAGGASGEVRREEAKKAAAILGAEVTVLDFPDGNIPVGKEAIDRLDQFLAKKPPQRVYIPYDREIHQDHRAVSQIALSACRAVPQILMYEGPSTYPDFSVNVWIDIAETIATKEKALAAHESQGHKEILKIEAVRALNRFRGYQARTEYAEGFHSFRFIEG